MIHLNLWQDVIGIYLGEADLDLAHFIAYYIVAIIGALYSFYKDVKRAVKYDPKTPNKFKWGYMILDNLARGIVAAAVIAILIIKPELIGFEKMNVVSSFLIGYGLDSFVVGDAMKGAKSTPVGKKIQNKLVGKYKNE